MQYLIDTGVLLRLFDRSDAAQPMIRVALRTLHRSGHVLVASSQNIAEFWNVSTRPATARGGYGQSVATTERRVKYFERWGRVLTESDAAYRAWRRLVVDHGLQGLAVHDARLVALMEATGITHVVTLNVKDFARYQNISVLSPRDVLGP
jgi:predicted nucleic acid-binding protein